MSKQLIESIVSNKMLEANDMLEAKLNEIRERKLYEMKRMYASEAWEGDEPYMSAKTKEGLAQGKRKAADVLGDPRDPSAMKPKEKEKDDGVTSGMRRTLRGMHRNKTNPFAGAKLIGKNLGQMLTLNKPFKRIGRIAKVVSTSPTVKKIDKTLDSPVGKELGNIGTRNL